MLGGLEVAVDDASGVRRFDGLRDLLGDCQRLWHGQRPVGEEFRQRWAVDQFEDQCLDETRLFNAVQRRDVWMVESCEHARLTLESGQPIGIGGKRIRQDLERHLATEAPITGTIDLAHATGTDEGDDLVVPERRPSGKRHE